MATFKARARALDMLGRQQIAGIPTAISELFKNAHDAYADHAEVDYYKSDNLFILRDDGLGMTRDDFQERWLTLGTESKVGRGGISLPTRDANKKQRPLLGEKGIGRLAIALLGRQLLVLSRAKREDGLQDLVAAYIHWGLFECPGLDLDQIEIPIRTFTMGTLPSAKDLDSMLKESKDNIIKLREEGQLSAEIAEEILSDIALFTFDPAELDSYIPSLSLAGNGHGTHFIIKPASSLLADTIEIEDDDRASDLVRMLAGFTNTMIPEHEDPVLKTVFRYHKTDDYSENLIDPSVFFTSDEFLQGDHRISGKFDEYGQFLGTISVYGHETENHQIVWKESRGKQTQCGPFSIDFVSVQGEERISLIEHEEWNALTRKMNKFGGLYIYRNGIRILPYGNSDYDWLDIERNRTKKASTYFFSYRRLFGVVNLKHGENDKLFEKAGREGFRENEAYRQFKGILKNFFVQLAKDFFQEQSPDDFFHTKKNELEKLDIANKKREKQTSTKKKIFEKELLDFFIKYDNKQPFHDVEQFKINLNNSLNQIGTLNDSYLMSERLINFESEITKEFNSLKNSYLISKPKGIAFSKKTQQDWIDYVSTKGNLDENLFLPALSEFKILIENFANQNSIHLDKYYRVERAIEDLSKEAKNITTTEKRNTESLINELQKKVIDVTRESSKRISNTINQVHAELARIDVNNDEQELSQTQENFEKLLSETKEYECERLRSIQAQLDAIDLSGEVGNFLDQIEAVEQRAINLEEQAEVDLQLTQLGMAIEIINHEFNSTILAVRHNLRRLKTWADLNPGLQEVYLNTRNSFEHLDGYLTLFTPLHRRLYRKEIIITGLEIYNFIKDLFSEKFQRHSVSFLVSDSFKNAQITGYPSSFYPVFVNLIDNATHWCKGKANATISLDYINDSTFTIKDNGSGIPTRDLESIFESGFSRKPGGRGMGLYISKAVLAKANYQLIAVESAHGAEFHISPVSNT